MSVPSVDKEVAGVAVVGPRVSVIMAARGAGADLRASVAAILAGSWTDLELVVADGDPGGNAALAAWAAREPRLRVVPNPTGTTPAGLNRALAAARGEVVVRMDAHCLPAADFVAQCVAALQQTGAQAVGGPLSPTGKGRFGRAAARAMRSTFGGGPAAFRRSGWGPTDTVYLGAWRRAELLAWGGFAEGLPRNQDYELAVRIRGAGGTVWLDPAIRSRTQARRSPLGLARQYFGYGCGRAGTVTRHPDSLRLRQAAPAAAVATAAALGLAACMVRPARVALVAAGAVYAASAVGAAWRVRETGDGLADLALTTAAFPLMHAPWGAGFWWGMFAERRGR